MAVNHVLNLLRQKHHAVVSNLHGPDGLGGSKATVVPDIVIDEVYPLEAEQPATRWVRHHMEPVSAMPERKGEADMNYDNPAPPMTIRTRNPQKVHRIPSDINYGRVRSPWTKHM